MFAHAFLVIASITFASAFTCPDNGQHILPHPTICAKYYMCNNGQVAELECTGSLVFNPERNMCDSASNVNCVDASGVSEGPVGNCPASNNNGYVDFLTDASDCSVYYECDWGKAVKMSCPSGLHFNSKLHVCDWPQSAGCTAAH